MTHLTGLMFAENGIYMRMINNLIKWTKSFHSGLVFWHMASLEASSGGRLASFASERPVHFPQRLTHRQTYSPIIYRLSK